MENKQDILKQLSSNDMDIVRGAIEQIKQEGDISIVPELLDILLQSQDTNIITNLTLGRERIRLQNSLDG